MTSTRIRRTAVAVAAGVAVSGLAAAFAAPANAATLTVAYDAKGSTVVVKPGSTIALGPTTLTSNLNNKGAFTGTLPIPSTTTSFKAFGLLPVSATVNFIEVGKLKGKLTQTGTRTSVSATAQYTINLSNVKVAGLPAFVGKNCQTADPVKIPVATPKNKKFDITKGGVVSGTYTIGDFSSCGLTTALVNQLVPGSGNTVSFTLSNGRVISD